MNEGTAALAEVINDLDRIMGNGSTGHEPMLGLDYGTAEEWAEHIVIGLTKRGLRISPDEAIVDAYERGRREATRPVDSPGA